MTEAELMAEVVTAIQARGLLHHRCTDSRHCRGPAGFPDLVVAGSNGVILAELKGDGGETTAEQDRWLWTIHETGSTKIRGTVWTPDNWRSGLIRAQLDQISGSGGAVTP